MGIAAPPHLFDVDNQVADNIIEVQVGIHLVINFNGRHQDDLNFISIDTIHIRKFEYKDSMIIEGGEVVWRGEKIQNTSLRRLTLPDNSPILLPCESLLDAP